MRGSIRASALVSQSAPGDRVRVVFPVGFDPLVSGWPAPVGTVGMRADGTLGWIKWAVADTGWITVSKVAVVAGNLSPLLAALDRTGILEFPVANAFDPSVSGLVAPVGSRATTLDGTKTWNKWGTADRNWAAGHVISGTLGTPAAAVQWSGLDVASNGGFEIKFRLAVDSGSGDVAVWVNGASTGNGQVTSARGAVVSAAGGSWVAGGTIAPLFGASTCSGVIWCAGGATETDRQIYFRSGQKTSSTAVVQNEGRVLLPASTEITSVSLVANLSLVLAASSSWSVRRFVP